MLRKKKLYFHPYSLPQLLLPQWFKHVFLHEILYQISSCVLRRTILRRASGAKIKPWYNLTVGVQLTNLMPIWSWSSKYKWGLYTSVLNAVIKEFQVYGHCVQSLFNGAGSVTEWNTYKMGFMWYYLSGILILFIIFGSKRRLKR